MNKMRCHSRQKYQFIFLAFFAIYLSNLNVYASFVDENSYAVANQQKGDMNVNDPYFAKKFKCPLRYGLFPDVEDCSKYYVCVAGISRRMPCPPFLNFDKYSRQCRSIFIATCDKGEDDKDTTRPDEKIVKEKIFLCTVIFGTYSHSTDCSKYYKCYFYAPSLRTCPKKKLYDEMNKECRPETEVDCESRNKPTKKDKDTTRPEEKITTVKEKIFLCTRMFGTYPHPTDCSKYYTCSFFVPSLKTCPKKKLFHEAKKACRPESEVDCESRYRPTTETRIVTTPLYTEPTTPEVATIPEETTPETTTTEDSTIAEEETTTELPTGPPETDCDEDDLDCIITETGKIPVWYKCPTELDSYSHPSSKRLFIFCINWKPKVKKCGQDLIYTQKLKTCVSP